MPRKANGGDAAPAGTLVSGATEVGTLAAGTDGVAVDDLLTWPNNGISDISGVIDAMGVYAAVDEMLAPAGVAAPGVALTVARGGLLDRTRPRSESSAAGSFEMMLPELWSRGRSRKGGSRLKARLG
mmetsp:Transcript_61880/g.108370  ORF Transcript_61880/g.108370 Transcript_61880/m.108370 type:complete len:127 (+) Transcript_61880:86-466(+)